MTRQRFTLPADVRTELITRADALAVKLMEQGLDKEDAAEVVELVTGEALEVILEALGAPDPLADAIADRLVQILPKVVEALRPDPEKLMERAMEAMKAGDGKKSRRLMARAERVLARQGGGE